MDSIAFVPTNDSDTPFVSALVDTGWEETKLDVGRGVLFGCGVRLVMKCTPGMVLGVC
jgi:hypothetical protein